MGNSDYNVREQMADPQVADAKEFVPTVAETLTPDRYDQDAPADQPAFPTQTRWPGTVTFFIRPIRPIWATKRTDQVGLIKAYLFHIVTAILGFLAVMLVSAVSTAIRHEFVNSVGSEFVKIGDDLWVIANRYPNEFLLGVAVSVGIVELSFAIFALLLAPWGARDEKFKTSLSHAFRQSWLHTINIVVAIVICAVATVVIGYCNTAWRITHTPDYGIYLTPPNVPKAQQSTSPEWKAYMKKYQEQQSRYWSEYQKWQRNWPWWVYYEEEVIGVVWCAGAFWTACSFAMAVGTRRRVTPMERPPLCENCGYNLSGTDRDSRCPECGEGVELSFGANLRTGPAWQQYYERKRICSDAVRSAPRGLKPAAQGMGERGNVPDGNDAVVAPPTANLANPISPHTNPASPLTKGGLRGVDRRVDLQNSQDNDAEQVGMKDSHIPIDKRPWRAFFDTAISAIRNPKALGRQLSLTRDATAYRSFIALNLVFTLILVAVGLSLYFLAVEGWRLFNRRTLQDYVSIIVFSSLAITAGLFIFSQLSAIISGISYRIRAKRNVLAGAQQAASYLSSYLLCWVIVAALSGAVMASVTESYWLKPMLGKYWANYDLIATIIWTVPNVILLIYYFVLVSRATAATRYANS